MGYKKPDFLDLDWEKCNGIVCPFCRSKKMWYDNNNEKDANYYCANCDRGMLIIDSTGVRGDKRKSN